MNAITIAAVQAAPVFLDRRATLERLAALTREAAAAGAGLVVFPEAFVPGYPDWVWRTRPWQDGARELHARLLEQAVALPGPASEAMAEIAAESGVYLAVGVDELSATDGTLYNTLLYYGPEGRLLGKHRKLMPTGGERLVWGQGDGSTLTVLDTPFGRLGGLLCWESYMPLARAAMYARGIDIYLAPTWDNGETWVPTMRHVAREGRCYVVGVNSCMRGSDVPAGLPERDALYGGDEDWLSRGNTVIVGPDGGILAGPLVGEPGIVYAEVDARVARAARLEFDPVGHYARPDVFELRVDGRPRSATDRSEPVDAPPADAPPA
ncbi:MAG: carbon-nitrogen hydrolase family protein [Chloroflexi bacterium]|nr:carbon-nitrogen hydrolase family protein [Chloroflexota bacterium]